MGGEGWRCKSTTMWTFGAASRQKTFTDNCPHLPQFGPIIGAIRSTGAGTGLIQRFEAFPKTVQVNMVQVSNRGKGPLLSRLYFMLIPIDQLDINMQKKN